MIKTLKQFQKEFHENKIRNSSMPEHTVPKTTFSDKTEKKLKQAIQAFAKLNGYGFLTYDSRGRQLPNGKWGFSHMTKGAADCLLFVPQSVTILSQEPKRFSIVVHVEIKMPGDRQRNHQREFQIKAESRGERYIMPSSFETFIDLFNQCL